MASRWLAPDPLAEEFSEWSPYHYAGDNPVLNIDVQGLFKLPAHLIQKYPAFASYLQNNVQEVLNSDALMSSLQANGGFDRATIENDLQWGEGPTVDIRKLGGKNLTAFGYYDGKQPDGSFKLSLDEDMLGKFEKAFGNEKISDDVKQGLLLGVVSTLLHEYTHHGTGGAVFEDEEMGHKFKLEAYGQYIEPDDINGLMQILRLKKSGQLINPSNHREVLDEQPENRDPSVLPTLPNKND